MKKYNENILKTTRKLSSNTLHKSRNTVKRLTDPNNQTQMIGSRIGLGAGAFLFVLGGSYFLWRGDHWGVWTVIAGIATIISNMIQLKRKKGR